jgi:pyrophosphatase PpaX
MKLEKTSVSASTVLFDFDGTIMNTNDLIIDSWQHTYRTIEGREGDKEAIVRTFGEPLLKSMEKAFPQVPPEKAVEIYRNYHLDSFGDRITLFPGMKELIEELYHQGVKLGLVTSRMRATTDEAMTKYGIGSFFQSVVTWDDTHKHKPDPEPVYIALRKLKSQPEESIMVGDSMYDILCARNAGVRSVLVGWALAVTEEEKNGPQGPDYFINEPSDILKMLGNLW